MFKHLPTLAATLALAVVLAAPAAQAAGDKGKGQGMGKNQKGMMTQEQKQLEARWGVKCSEMGDQAKINECVAGLKNKEQKRLKTEKKMHKQGDKQ